MNPAENHPATAPTEVWNTYNNVVKKDKHWLAVVQAQGVTAARLKDWHHQSSAWQDHAYIILGLAEEPQAQPKAA